MEINPIVATLEQATKRYGPVTAVDGIDLEVRRGEVVAMLGPNGAGKTTAIHLLLGLVRPDGGSARLFGRDPSSREVRIRTGVMLQSAAAPETMRVREQIDLFCSYYPDPLSIDNVLRIARLEHLADRKLDALSGGEKQRLMFALAICGNPDLLFLDEPTVGLDIEMRRSLWEAIRTFTSEGRTILMTTHYLEEADALASRIVVVRSGKLIADGSPAEIKSRVAARKITCRTAIEPGMLQGIAGVQSIKTSGDLVNVLSIDAEATVRELLARDTELSGLEVTGATLEEAFLAMTREEEVAA